jgi:hypothetical protein
MDQSSFVSRWGWSSIRRVFRNVKIRKSVPTTFFLHIAKTGGTSLTASLSTIFKKYGINVYAMGDLTEENLLIINDIGKTAFIAGHWGHNTFRSIPKNAFKFTVLRDPRDQTVSNYLHICRNNTEMSNKARELGFSKFIKAYPYFAIFQSGSLLLPIRSCPIDYNDIVALGDGYFDEILSRFEFVGCLEYADDLAICLPRALGFSEPLTFVRANRAKDYGVSQEVIDALQHEYDDLSRSPELGQLIAAERRVYEKAAMLAHRRSGALEEAREEVRRSNFGSSQRGSVTLHFEAEDPRIRTEVGEKLGQVIRVNSQQGCALFGPYVDLGMGRYTAAVQLIGERRGGVHLNMSAECGERILADRRIDLRTLETDTLEISADLSRPFSECEVRVICDGDVKVTIGAVTIRYEEQTRNGAVFRPKRRRRIRQAAVQVGSGPKGARLDGRQREGK